MFGLFRSLEVHAVGMLCFAFVWGFMLKYSLEFVLLPLVERDTSCMII
jgi:hypothetical protein